MLVIVAAVYSDLKSVARILKINSNFRISEREGEGIGGLIIHQVYLNFLKIALIR